ncbi:Hsp20/alpha crystallin family protein [Bacillus sp. FJAT-49736]|uniref:Hsp20/alpha crystallin family protein n=1 Tax=Bacillus sp. FJAT-49736 TaxID=2833582 RepID=UPI001BC9F5A1|nr:Hsp20/alpha crystallin family protein [Bacillus sp. FJAT-49736]MBS4173235.1 Hsp20/alpha crystallin family protein [Bacillus sp. FJAT-49736]
MSEKLPGKSDNNPLHDPFQGLMRSMNNFFHEPPVKGFLESIDEFFSSPFPFSSFPVDLNETDKEYIITAKLSGVKKDQINIDIFQQYITITVENTESATQENQTQKTIFKKNSIQRTSRTIPLQKPISEAKVKANYEDGLLTISVPKEGGKRLKIE